jgi:hypothetical protein
MFALQGWSGEAQACAACGCLVNNDFQTQGLTTTPGWMLGLSYDYVNQNRLMLGSKDAAGQTDLSLPNAQEIEQLTRTSTATLHVNYTSATWGMNVRLPYLDRYHVTYPPGNTTTLSSQSRTLGDMQVLGRYTGLSDTGGTGLLLGLKLPTGPFHETFSDGSALDRSLQPGSGSTDIMAGAFTTGNIGHLSWFVQGLWQSPVLTQQDYRPGYVASLDVGLRYGEFGQRIVPMLQVNAIQRGRDAGLQATPDTTGGRLVYVAPGIFVRVGHGVSAYALVQLPVYQHVNGLQLVPRYIPSAGIMYRL